MKTVPSTPTLFGLSGIQLALFFSNVPSPAHCNLVAKRTFQSYFFFFVIHLAQGCCHLYVARKRKLFVNCKSHKQFCQHKIKLSLFHMHKHLTINYQVKSIFGVPPPNRPLR